MLLVEVPAAISSFLLSGIVAVILRCKTFYLWQTLQACQVGSEGDNCIFEDP